MSTKRRDCLLIEEYAKLKLELNVLASFINYESTLFHPVNESATGDDKIGHKNISYARSQNNRVPDLGRDSAHITINAREQKVSDLISGRQSNGSIRSLKDHIATHFIFALNNNEEARTLKEFLSKIGLKVEVDNCNVILDILSNPHCLKLFMGELSNDVAMAKQSARNR